MLSYELAATAFHTRAAQVVVGTTGVITLSATATGYARTTGSFLTDGFAPGMEVVPTGFPQTARGVIKAIDTLTMTIDGGRTVATAAGSRSLSVGLPELIAYTNTYVNNVPVTPVPGRPYLVEKLVPGASRNLTIPANGGLFEEDVLAIWNWYFVAGRGSDAINRTVVAFKKRFTPGTVLTLSDGAQVRVRGDTAVKHSEPLYVDAWAVVTITVPCRAVTQSVVAA